MALPAGAELRDLGEHRLRDLLEPEHVYQLLHPDLPATFPPLNSLDTRPHNLPRQPTPFLGREQQVDEVVALLRRADVQLVTLIGPGGTGKTRLALQAAAELLDDFTDGVFFVPLAPLTESASRLRPRSPARLACARRAGNRWPIACETSWRQRRCSSSSTTSSISSRPLLSSGTFSSPRRG